MVTGVLSQKEISCEWQDKPNNIMVIMIIMFIRIVLDRPYHSWLPIHHKGPSRIDLRMSQKAWGAFGYRNQHPSLYWNHKKMKEQKKREALSLVFFPLVYKGMITYRGAVRDKVRVYHTAGDQPYSLYIATWDHYTPDLTQTSLVYLIAAEHQRRSETNLVKWIEVYKRWMSRF